MSQSGHRMDLRAENCVCAACLLHSLDVVAVVNTDEVWIHTSSKASIELLSNV